MLIATFLLAASLASPESGECFPEAFRAELAERAARDQAARRAYIEGGMKPGEEKPILAIDLDNTAWLRAQVQACGWPPQSRVGEDGSLAAWLIAQHADATPDFQREAAAAMLPKVEAGEASGQRLALLVDRHARLQEIPQTYGMQYHLVEGRIRFLPVNEPVELDARRARIGLPSFACHVQALEAQQQAKADWPGGVERKPCEAPETTSKPG
jgi:hypothetical protein